MKRKRENASLALPTMMVLVALAPWLNGCFLVGECTAAPSCPSGYEVASSCGDNDDCFSANGCGDPAVCIPSPSCDAEPVCPEDYEQVPFACDTSNAAATCVEVSACGSTIVCDIGGLAPCMCPEGNLVDFCDVTTQPECSAFPGTGDAGCSVDTFYCLAPQCTAVATCQLGELEVTSCPSTRTCNTYEECSTSINCVPEAECDYDPICPLDMEPVESCAGMDGCENYTACGATISCISSVGP